MHSLVNRVVQISLLRFSAAFVASVVAANPSTSTASTTAQLPAPYMDAELEPDGIDNHPAKWQQLLHAESYLGPGIA